MTDNKPQIESRTKLPTEIDQEDPFIMFAEFKMSLRQTLTILVGLVVWVLAWQLTEAILPVPGVLAALLWSWLVIASLVLTFVRKDGEPYEEYLSQKIEFWLSDKHYINIDTRKHDDIEDADWEELDEDAYFFDDPD